MNPETTFNDCANQGEPDPCTIVILGATGDLTSRKLLPALFDLYTDGSLPPRFVIMGCGRSAWTDDTSMALCLAESLIQCQEFDPADQMSRYLLACESLESMTPVETLKSVVSRGM